MLAIRAASGIGHTHQPRETSRDGLGGEPALPGPNGSGMPTLVRTTPTLPSPCARNVSGAASLREVTARDASACLPDETDKHAMACARPF